MKGMGKPVPFMMRRAGQGVLRLKLPPAQSYVAPSSITGPTETKYRRPWCSVTRGEQKKQYNKLQMQIFLFFKKIQKNLKKALDKKRP
ncbi:MAG: hypothetical protein LUD18_12530 [Lachnospiraceae bacterium]|nr:hypothetical protein [Lachnospiraceae bacterium]